MAAVLSRFRHRLTSALPPSVRRAGAGLVWDVRSLPKRLRDPARWGDPWQTAHNIGGGDFRQIGDDLVQLLIAHAGLRPGDRVLDIGCGTGRVARPLGEYLDAGEDDQPRYVGFDPSRRAVAGCRRRIGRSRPDFRFLHADIRNSDYNAKGGVDATACVFPCADASIDVAFAISVFTHMQTVAVARYLMEASRVLAPGGRLAFTAYLVDEARREILAAGASRMPFERQDDGSWLTDPARPERAVAHERPAIIAAIEGAGLRPALGVLRGDWAGPASYSGWQDLIVLEKR